ncbi:protein phosphatase 2C domain-containing protein [Paenibacillus thermotolerans]|uniref:protein phosphatase 2C domain-containing protein n=1 Tax=Paenibacillus thermotolerans TaxID=3027807 RepID=UPI002367C20B|nr:MULTISPECIES: protein phosphatase 2C domain-containing protein [unclassified Paenibacillus]
MKIHAFSLASPLKRECEDAYFVNAEAGIYGVLDGVTPLHDFKDESGHNGAFLASNLFKAYFERLNRVDTLSDGIVQANRLLRNKMIEYRVDFSVKHELWSTCIAAVHIRSDTVSYAQLGDCMALARFADGTVRVLTENRVEGVSERARAKRERERNNGVELPDESFYDAPRNRWIYQRWMANTPDGYGVANGTDEVQEYIQSGSLQTSGLTHLLLMSDGMFFPGKSLETAFEMLLTSGFESYAEQVKQAEQASGLQPDDRTAILLEF